MIEIIPHIGDLDIVLTPDNGDIVQVESTGVEKVIISAPDSTVELQAAQAAAIARAAAAYAIEVAKELEHELADIDRIPDENILSIIDREEVENGEAIS